MCLICLYVFAVEFKFVGGVAAKVEGAADPLKAQLAFKMALQGMAAQSSASRLVSIQIFMFINLLMHIQTHIHIHTYTHIYTYPSRFS